MVGRLVPATGEIKLVTISPVTSDEVRKLGFTVAAEATQAVGALLLLGLLTGPAAAAHRLTGRPFAGIALAGLLGVGAMWGGLALGYAVPQLPPSTAIVTLAVGVYAVAALVGIRTRRGVRGSKGNVDASSSSPPSPRPSPPPASADAPGATIAT